MKHITLYATSTCPHCKKLKAYFSEKNVDYKLYEVDHDQSKLDEMAKISGGMSVPVLLIQDGDKEEVIVGFNKTEIDKVLGLD